MIKKVSIILLCTLFLLPVTGPTAAVDGVTDKEVTIGMSGPLSGPGALWGVVLLGASAWADYVNERGGVHGRKIKVLMRDDAYNPARALANLMEMKGKVFAVSPLMGTAIVHAAMDFLAHNRIFCINPTVDVRIFEKYPKDKLRWFFISYPDYLNEGEFLVDYAVKNLAAKKVSLFYQNDPMGQMYVEGAKLALSKLPAGRASLGVTIPYDVNDRALATQALKLKEGGADTLVISATPIHAALILKEMAKIDYRPKVLTASVLGDPIMYSIVGADVWEGVYPAGMAHTGAPGDPAVNRVIDIIKKYDPRIAGKEYLGLFGAVAMMHTVEGLKNAGRDLTPESMIRGMEMIKNWRPEGLGAPVTYGPDRRHGLNGSRLMRAEKGKHVPITDYVIYKPLF